MGFKVSVTATFEREYDSAISYLAEHLDSPAAANNLMNSMQDMRDALAQFYAALNYSADNPRMSKIR